MRRREFNQVRDRFARDEGLPFGRLLTRERVLQALADEGHQYRSRVFCPLVTLWGWLSQCLSQDKSLNEAVSRVLAHRVATGLPTISASSAAYSKSRTRFPEAVMARLAREIGRRVHDSATASALWRGREVFLIDGTGLTMPDSPENHLAYPRQNESRTEVGFPLVRASALISLATGAVIDLEFGQFIGKGTGETTLLRKVLPSIRPGSVLIGDKLYAAYSVLGYLVANGIDAVVPIPVNRRREGSLVVWDMPRSQMCPEMYVGLPESITLRQFDVEIEERDGTPKTLTLVSTILDPAVSDAELAELYRQRWNCEVDLRSIKISMQLDVLRAKTPDMVRKEIDCHILAYNLLRGVMVESAAKIDALPRHLSIKGAMQAVESFTAPMMAIDGNPAIYDAFLATVSAHRVGNRPGRVEPRLVKRRPKRQALLMLPRHKYFRRLASGAA